MTTTHNNKEWKGALRSKYYNGWHVLWIIFIVTSISVSIVFLYVAFCQPYCVLCIHIVSRVLTLTLFWSFQAFVFALIGFRKLLFQLVLLLLLYYWYSRHDFNLFHCCLVFSKHPIFMWYFWGPPSFTSINQIWPSNSIGRFYLFSYGFISILCVASGFLVI